MADVRNFIGLGIGLMSMVYLVTGPQRFQAKHKVHLTDGEALDSLRGKKRYRMCDNHIEEREGSL